MSPPRLVNLRVSFDLPFFFVSVEPSLILLLGASGMWFEIWLLRASMRAATEDEFTLVIVVGAIELA